MNQRVIGISERKGRSKVNNICTTTMLVIALCTAVLSTDAEAASPYVYKVEDPADFLVGDMVYSGPQPGEKLSSFSVIPPRRDRQNDQFDPVALGLGKPHIIIFIDDSDIGEGIRAYVSSVVTVRKHSRSGLAASVVILAHERATGVPFAKYGAEEPGVIYMNTVYRIGYAPDGRDGPGAYGLNRNFPLTILIADAEGNVLHNFPFREVPPDFPNPNVLGGLADAVGEDRETVASWLNKKAPEASNMQKREMKKKDMENKDNVQK
jgi:hypothetical protein